MSQKELLTTYSIIFLHILLCGAYAGEVGPYSCEVISSNGVVMSAILVGGYRTNTTDQRIQLIFKMPKGKWGIIYRPTPEYLGTIVLLDSRTNAVRRTEMGRRYGRKAREIRWDLSVCEKVRGNSVRVTVTDDWQAKFELPPVSEMFDFKDDLGAYRLVLELQMLLEETSAGSKKREILVFPRLEIPVIRVGFEPVLPKINQ